MAQSRRLLISIERLKKIDINNSQLKLTQSEFHYLKRVLRLNNYDQINIVDGLGRLWKSSLKNSFLILESELDRPFIFQSNKNPYLFLAVVIPKQGFEDVLRMTCEIGIDGIQPLFSARSVVTSISQERFNRWNSILKEAVEQSERLWMPNLYQPIHLQDWINKNKVNTSISLANTRSISSINIEKWLISIDKEIDKIYVVIGPEGGWTESEINLIKKYEFQTISLGDSILRTSTAAISASQMMCSWKRTIT